MRGPWRARAMKREGVIVWVIYRLRDAAGGDEETNREYYTVSGTRAWAATAQGAELYARIFNAARR